MKEEDNYRIRKYVLLNILSLKLNFIGYNFFFWQTVLMRDSFSCLSSSMNLVVPS